MGHVGPLHSDAGQPPAQSKIPATFLFHHAVRFPVPALHLRNQWDTFTTYSAPTLGSKIILGKQVYPVLQSITIGKACTASVK